MRVWLWGGGGGAVRISQQAVYFLTVTAVQTTDKVWCATLLSFSLFTCCITTFFGSYIVHTKHEVRENKWTLCECVIVRRWAGMHLSTRVWQWATTRPAIIKLYNSVWLRRLTFVIAVASIYSKLIFIYIYVVFMSTFVVCWFRSHSHTIIQHSV